LKALAVGYPDRPELQAFWAELRAGSEAFEREHRPPRVAIDAAGRYVVR
jgi:hypothetical protein